MDVCVIVGGSVVVVILGSVVDVCTAVDVVFSPFVDRAADVSAAVINSTE